METNKQIDMKLVLGITSIVTAFLSFFFPILSIGSLIVGICSLGLKSKSQAAGRVCAIIGIIISALVMLICIGSIILVGVALNSTMDSIASELTMTPWT